MRRTALESINGYDTSFIYYGDDIDTARRLLKTGDVVWTYALPLLTSGRRIRGQGILKSGYLYAGNFFSVILFGRPMSMSHEDFRT